MLKFLVFVLFLSICTKCKGNPAISTAHRVRRGTDNIGCGELAPESDQLLVNFNGTEAKRGAHPWHVALYLNENNTYICGGTIINENMIVTAATCVTTVLDGIVKPATDYYIQAGKLYSRWDANEDEGFVQKRTISKIVKTKYYLGEKSTYSGDLAIMVVNEPFDLTSPFVRSVCVDWNLEYVDEQLKSGVLGQVVGWGTSSATGYNAPSSFLKQYKFPFIELEQCVSTVPRSFVPYITLDKYCAGYTNGTAICSGDSGNGMIFSKDHSGTKKYYIQGIASVGVHKDGQCDESQLSIYTKVSAHIKWLKEAVEANKTK